MLIRRVEGYGIDKSWRPLNDISAPDPRRDGGRGREVLPPPRLRLGRDRHNLGSLPQRTPPPAWRQHHLELAWDKRRIMEIYLNVAECGPGVYGAEAAAQHYFHKPADALNPEEAVRLAAALPDPLRWSPRRPGRRLLAHGAAIRANLPGVPMALPLPCGTGRT